MAGATIQFDWQTDAAGKVRRLLQRMANLRPVWDEFGSYKVDDIRSHMPRQDQPSQPGGYPAQHSGMHGLAGSLTYQAGTKLLVGSNRESAALLHFGGTVHAKDKLLTVPIDESARGKRAREFDGLAFVPSARGHRRGLLVRRTGGGGMRVMFALYEQITVKARPYLKWLGRDMKYLMKALRRRFKASR